jgi:hypothetical protein
MKTLALWLYGLSFLTSMIIGPIAFPFLAFFVTVFLGLVAVFDILFSGIKKARQEHREAREHREWII